MERHAIAWNTVEVTRGARNFELSVRLSAEPSSDWELLFNQAAQKEALSPEGRGWSYLRLSEGTISMRELDPDSRDHARRYLNDIVERTNGALAARLEAAEQERLRIEQEEAELARKAEELTEWFRSSAPGPAQSSPATGEPEAASSEPAASEQADRGELRDRLLHGFRPEAA